MAMTMNRLTHHLQSSNRRETGYVVWRGMRHFVSAKAGWLVIGAEQWATELCEDYGALLTYTAPKPAQRKQYTAQIAAISGIMDGEAVTNRSSLTALLERYQMAPVRVLNRDDLDQYVGALIAKSTPAPMASPVDFVLVADGDFPTLTYAESDLAVVNTSGLFVTAIRLGQAHPGPGVAEIEDLARANPSAYISWVDSSYKISDSQAHTAATAVVSMCGTSDVRLGNAKSNHVAEIMAINHALELAIQNGKTSAVVMTDSATAYHWTTARLRSKHEGYAARGEFKRLSGILENVTIIQVKRSQTRAAHRLAYLSLLEHQETMRNTETNGVTPSLPTSTDSTAQLIDRLRDELDLGNMPLDVMVAEMRHIRETSDYETTPPTASP